MKLFGMALIRNGVKFDYPFRESLLSMKPLVEKIHIAVGKSGDGTEEALQTEEFKSLLHIIPTVWDDSRTDRGHIFSEQTNVALNSLRETLKNSKDYSQTFAVYLQSDELFHDDEIPLIKEDLKKALEGGYDAVAFRYFHFWQHHNQIAINKKCYPVEVRAIKLDSAIESYGDAQGFRNQQKIYYSDAHIYHYGHVRDNKAYQEKMEQMIHYYHPEQGFTKYKKKWHRKDKNTETIPFLGNHPQIMKERMERIGGIFEQPKKYSANRSVYILSSHKREVENFRSRINAEKVMVVDSLTQVPWKEWKNLVVLQPHLAHKIFFPSVVPQQMRSKLASPWPLQTLLLLKLSEKGIGLKKANG